MKKLLFVLISIGLLLVMLMFIWTNSAPPAANDNIEEPKIAETQAIAPKILVAKHPIQAGAFLRSQDFKWAEFNGDKNELNTLFLKDFIQPDSLEGSLITESLSIGQPLTIFNVVRPEQSQYLSSMLAPGKKGVTLDITFAGGSYGLIKPGNYVDIILTTSKEHQSSEGFGETLKHANSLVLENVRLLAVDNTLTDIVRASENNDQLDKFNQTSEATLPVTFEVDIQGAQRLLLARKLGDLSLLLRSAKPMSHITDGQNITLWDEQISDNHNPGLVPDNSIRIFDGQDVRTIEHR
ncbi:Flp pilus assembly protein CpaB [Vibrio sonorensis]|uniref:Flp pilus assembly protein CpaB n=1 Tax=Vibrio sonorensis TaxID=1004316 RepID=UPI000A02BBA7|nr:Flp pilus assembly protein CpaB [Vibrio sonorensis]